MRIKIFLILIFTLALNLIWEFSHYQLYVDLTRIPSTFHLIGASFIDVFLIAIIFIAVSLKNKNIKWLKKPMKKDYLSLIIFGLILAFFWELINLNLGRWEYKEIMPTIFNVGLSPLVQLAITSTISLKLGNLIFKNNNIIHHAK